MAIISRTISLKFASQKPPQIRGDPDWLNGRCCPQMPHRQHAQHKMDVYKPSATLHCLPSGSLSSRLGAIARNELSAECIVDMNGTMREQVMNSVRPSNTGPTGPTLYLPCTAAGMANAQ